MYQRREEHVSVLERYSASRLDVAAGSPVLHSRLRHHSRISQTMKYATYQVPRNLDPNKLNKFALLNREAARSIPGLVLFRGHELAWTSSDWLKQLQDPSKFYFACVAPTSEAHEHQVPTLDTGKWVGICACRGPLAEDQYTFPEITSDDFRLTMNETRWHGGRMFLRPAHRNPSAFDTLTGACEDFMRHYTLEHLNKPSGTCLARMHTTLSAGSPIEPLYRANGADNKGHVTIVESLQVSDSLKDVADDILSSEDHTVRDRALLEWVIQC